MPRATVWAPALLPSRGGVTAHPSSLDRPCARRLRDLAVGMEECSRRGSNQRMTQGSEGLMFAEQVELPRAIVRLGYDGLVVTVYLGEVGCLELQGEFHQGVRNVSGGFIGDGIFGRFGWALARHRGRSELTRRSRPSCGSS